MLICSPISATDFLDPFINLMPELLAKTLNFISILSCFNAVFIFCFLFNLFIFSVPSSSVSLFVVSFIDSFLISCPLITFVFSFIFFYFFVLVFLLSFFVFPAFLTLFHQVFLFPFFLLILFLLLC